MSQGRSKKHRENNYKVTAISAVGLVILFFLLFLFKLSW